MTERTKTLYRQSLRKSATHAAEFWVPTLPWYIRWLGGNKIRNLLAIAFIEGAEWQDEQKYGD